MGSTPTARPLVVLRPEPQSSDRIFSAVARAALHERFAVADLEGEPTDAGLDALLPRAFAIVGQPDLPAERIERAPALRAIVNVEGNFFPNVDYAAAFARGVRVLGVGPAYADPVAEFALGLALDLARGITREDRRFRAGAARYLGEATHDAVLVRRADVGLIGYGNLGRALHRLLTPFAPTVRIHDPWLPEATIRAAGALACTLDEVLRASRFLFVVSAVTDANTGFIDAERMAAIPDGARVVLVSRAAVIDFAALLDRVRRGELLAAIDVWPDEPVPADHPARELDGLVLSPHRAGAIPSAFTEIGDMVLDDLTLLAAGLPPVRTQVAEPELVGRYRNKPAQHRPLRDPH